tara:strand:+ start:115 stop:423 length:309 start_codon:yes stop_codon:yes gene_type:complete
MNFRTRRDGDKLFVTAEVPNRTTNEKRLAVSSDNVLAYLQGEGTDVTKLELLEPPLRPVKNYGSNGSLVGTWVFTKKTPVAPVKKNAPLRKKSVPKVSSKEG